MKILALLFVLSAAAAPAGNPPATRSVRSGSSQAASLQDLAWIAGRWQGELRGAPIEETWGAPSGDNMVGMFRAVRDGKVRFYEIMVIEQEATGPVFRLKHFNRNLAGWEEKEAPQAYPLASSKPGEAVFESSDKEKPLRFIYRKTADDSLVIRIESVKDGKPSAQVFQFTRMR